jgi:beta-xylosidase
MGDPFVMKHKDIYYLYGTTAPFQCWQSSNLVDWDYAGRAYTKTVESWGTGSFWAPEVIPYRGKFYMVYSCKQPDGEGFRLCLAVAEKPAGPFIDRYTPWFDDGSSNIDGHIFIDKDGTPYLFFDKVGVVGEPWKGSEHGHLYGIIYGVQLKRDLSAVIGEPVECVKADQEWELGTTPGHMPSHCDEGAFVLRLGDTYYLTYSAGHYTDPLYGIGYATASAPLGPWRKGSDNPLVRRDLAAGVSGPGHSCVTTSPDGTELFLVYHAHANIEKPSGDRTVNIDRLTFNEDGRLKLLGPTRSPQPLPSGAK